MRDLSRLLSPKSIAVIGGGAWAASVIEQCRLLGFKGAIWSVHPKQKEIGADAVYVSVAGLPAPPDAAFVGVNREATIDVMRALADMGAGGAVCFASGFLESLAETGDGADLQAALVAAAGDMPFLGPNCYGFINTLEGAALWPDQHGAVQTDRGVAIVTQSSNIAINLTMQQRGLPVAYVVTAGNQAQTDLAQISMSLLQDPRVSALGLHIEGISDLPAFCAMARLAQELGKPIVALKVGASEQAQTATISHTASLAGSDAGARALLARLGIGQARSLASFLETLKLLHVHGPLAGNRLASMSCSGGEASLMADSALGLDVIYPPLNAAQRDALRTALGPKVALANPLDYHTYIWGDEEALTACFSAMMQGDLDLGIVVLDFPRPDRCSADAWDLVVNAVARTQKALDKPMAIMASLGETMPEHMAFDIFSKGILPINGMSEGLEAAAIAAHIGRSIAFEDPFVPSHVSDHSETLSEFDAKTALASHGLAIPKGRRVLSRRAAASTAQEIGFPVVVKGEGAAHKTEAGLVALNLKTAEEVQESVHEMHAQSFLVEEMASGTIVELLIGVVRDPAHGFVLTLGAGGTLTEILKDSQNLLLPVQKHDVLQALKGLKIAPMLEGYRGKDGVSLDAIWSAVEALQSYVAATKDTLIEIEINPLLCSASGAIAADALIRKGV
jgi:acyl-CoA synthetase (NDP forming)